MSGYQDCMNEVRQKAFEMGGLEDGSYHLEDDELGHLIRLVLSQQAEPVCPFCGEPSDHCNQSFPHPQQASPGAG